MIRRRACLAFHATAVLFSCAFVFAGCYSTPRPSGAIVEAQSSPRLEAASPIDVAIAPIVNTSGGSVPEAALRRGFQKALVKRRYSPLALELVDARVVDAAYAPGALKEGAVLQIDVERWDSSLWDTRGALVSTVRVRLVDARDPSQVLWTGSVTERRFDATDTEASFRTDPDRVQHVCDVIARELLDALPDRTPTPGPDAAGA